MANEATFKNDISSIAHITDIWLLFCEFFFFSETFHFGWLFKIQFEIEKVHTDRMKKTRFPYENEWAGTKMPNE